MAETLDQIPERVTAGESLAVILSVPACPASLGWALRWVLKHPEAPRVDVAGTPEGDAFRLDLPSGLSRPGRTHWQLWAAKGTESRIVGSGALEVEASLLDAAEGFDPRTHEERCLDAITALLEGRASEDMAEMKVGDRELKFYSHKELLELQAIYRARVRVRKGGALVRLIPVRLARA